MTTTRFDYRFGTTNIDEETGIRYGILSAIPTYHDFIPYVSFVVDDAGNGRELGADPHAIVRLGDQHTYGSVLIGWQCGFEPLVVAVHSYLDVDMDLDEAEKLARDYLEERGWFSGPSREADFIVKAWGPERYRQEEKR